MTALDSYTIIDTLRHLYRDSPAQAHKAIETYLARTLADIPPAERPDILATLKSALIGQNPPPSASDTPAAATISAAPAAPQISEQDLFRQFCTLIFGPSQLPQNLHDPRVVTEMTTSLNTVFDTLNEIIRLIDTTLGSASNGAQTIRHIIGARVEGSQPNASLEEYLNRIKIAFLVTHQAFQEAAHSTVAKILAELDPTAERDTPSGAFSFGPLRKAEKFDYYEKTFENCKKWFDSGRYMEDFIREFERNCQKLSLR